MGTNRKNTTRTLQKNLKRNNRKTQKGGGVRTAARRFINDRSGSTNTGATQGQTLSDIPTRVAVDNASRGWKNPRRLTDKVRDSKFLIDRGLSSDDPEHFYQMATSAGKRIGSDQGRYGHEHYDSKKQLDRNKKNRGKKKSFNRAQARQIGIIIGTFFDTAQQYIVEDKDNELMDIATQFLKSFMEDGIKMGRLTYNEDSYKKNIGQLTRAMPDYREEYRILDSETYEEHKMKVQKVVEVAYRTIETSIKNFNEKKKQEYLIKEAQKYKDYPRLHKYKYLEDLEFQTQIIERGKEYSRLDANEIIKRFEAEVFKLGIYSDEQIAQFLSRCRPGTKYEKPSPADKLEGNSYGKCIEYGNEESNRISEHITPWIFGEIIHIFDQFEYTCKQTDRAMKNNVDCGHKFRINKRKADNLKEEEYGYNKDYLKRLEKQVSIGSFDGQELMIGDIVSYTDLKKGISNRIGIVASSKDSSKIGKYKVAFLNNSKIYGIKKELDRKYKELFKQKSKLETIISNKGPNGSAVQQTYNKMLDNYRKLKSRYSKISKMGDFDKDKNGNIIQKMTESINLNKIGRVSTKKDSSDYNSIMANFVIRQMKIYGIDHYESSDKDENDVELDKFAYVSDIGNRADPTKGIMSPGQDRIARQQEQIKALERDLANTTSPGTAMVPTRVAGAAAAAVPGIAPAPALAGATPALTPIPSIPSFMGQAGGGDLEWTNADGTIAQSFDDWIRNGINLTTDKDVAKKKFPSTGLMASAQPVRGKKLNGKKLYFLSAEAKREFDGHGGAPSGAAVTGLPTIKNSSNSREYADLHEKALDRRKEHFKELCPQDLGCELIELFSVINPNLLTSEELKQMIYKKDKIEDLKIIAETHNCHREKIEEAFLAKPGKPFTIGGVEHQTPLNALRALIQSPIELGGAQVFSQTHRMAYILAYLELRNLPKIYIKLRKKLAKIVSVSDAIKKIAEIREKYRTNEKAQSYFNSLPKLPPADEDLFPREDSKLMYELKELLLFDIEEKEEETEKRVDLRLQDFKTKEEIIKKIQTVNPKYKSIFLDTAVEEQKLIPEFTVGNRTLEEQFETNLFNLLLRVLREKEFTTKHLIQTENIKKSIMNYLFENILEPKWITKNLGSIGSWKLDLEDLKPLNIDVMLLSCKADHEDFLLRIPHEIINGYIQKDYKDIWQDLLRGKEGGDSNDEVNITARKISKYMKIYDTFKNTTPYLKDDKQIYEDVKRITEYQTPERRKSMIREGARTVSLPSGALFYLPRPGAAVALNAEQEDDYQKMTWLIKLQKASQNITKLMRQQLLSDKAIIERESQQQQLINDMNILKYDLFVRDVGKKKIGESNIINYMDIFKPEYVAFTLTNCDIEQFNGEYYYNSDGPSGEEFFKLNNSQDEYDYFIKRASMNDKEYISTFGEEEYDAKKDVVQAWVIGARLKVRFKGRLKTQTKHYVYYFSKDYKTTKKQNIMSFNTNPNSSYYSIGKSGDELVPSDACEWNMTPLGSKLLEFQELGLQLGWPAYPHCVTSTIDQSTSYWKGLANVGITINTILGEAVSAMLPATVGGVAALISHFAAAAGATAAATYAAATAAVGGVTQVAGIAKGLALKTQGGVDMLGKQSGRSNMFSKAAKKGQSKSMSTYLVSAETLVKIANAGLKIRVAKGTKDASDEEELYDLAGQKINSGRGEKINFFRHPLNTKLPTIDGYVRDKGEEVDEKKRVRWWSKEGGLDEEIVQNKGIKKNVAALLKEAKVSNDLRINRQIQDDGGDISEKILYAINDMNAYDDDGTRILNNSISDFYRTTADVNRASTRGGFGKDSIDKIPNFRGGVIDAFNKNDCENPILTGSSERLYDIGGGNKKDAVEWILRPENINSLMIIANEMYSHDNAIDGDIGEGIFGKERLHPLFGNNVGPIWANPKYGRFPTGWRKLKLKTDTGGEGRKGWPLGSENDDRKKGSILTDLPEHEKTRYNKYGQDGSQFYIKEAARKGLTDTKGRPIARLLDEENEAILEAISKTWPDGEQLTSKKSDGQWGTIPDTKTIRFENTKMWTSLGQKAIKKFGMGGDKTYQNYLPGPLLLEIYYDKYPFNRYYRTKHDGMVDMKWSGHTLHGIWIDPRGQELISSLFTPSTEFKVTKNKGDRTPLENDVIKEFDEFSGTDELKTISAPTTNIGELFKYKPKINHNNVLLTLAFDRVPSPSEKKITFSLDEESRVIEFQVGPVINSRRSYIDINKKLALIWFTKFEGLKLIGQGNHKGKPLINYSSTAGWGLINLGLLLGEKAGGEVVLYSHQPGYNLNSKEGFYCCTSENMPPKENWMYLESEDGNFDHCISSDLYGKLLESVGANANANITQGKIGHDDEKKTTSEFLVKRGLPNYRITKKYSIESVRESGKEQIDDKTKSIIIYNNIDQGALSRYNGIDYFSPFPSRGAAFSSLNTVLYRNMDKEKAVFVNKNLSGWIRGLCRAQPGTLGSAKELPQTSKTIADVGPKGEQKDIKNKYYKETHCTECVQNSTAWNRTMESYSFTAWAYANNLQIGSTIRLSEDVIDRTGRNILQSHEDISKDDIFMIIGYNGYWNSYGLCDKVGPPGEKITPHSFTEKQINVGRITGALFAITLAILLATEWSITGQGELTGEITEAMSDYVPDFLENGVEDLGKIIPEDVYEHIADQSGEVVTDLSDTSPTLIDLITMTAADNIGDFAETIDYFDWFGGDGYAGDNLMNVFDDGWTRTLTEMGLAAGITAGVAEPIGESIGRNTMKNIDNLGEAISDFIDQDKIVPTSVANIDDLERRYNKTITNIYDPKEERMAYSDNIPIPIRLGWRDSLNSGKIEYRPELFYYAKTGDESMPNRIINGVEIYLQRLTNTKDRSKFVTISVPFNEDMNEPGDQMAVTSEGIYDIRKGWQITMPNEDNPDTGALESALMGVKNRIKNKIIPHYDINSIRELFEDIDKNSKEINEQIVEYYGAIERYAGININSCSQLRNMDTSKASSGNIMDTLLNSNTVDSELCDIFSKINSPSDEVIVIYEDKKILLEVIKALTITIVTGAYKEYNPIRDEWKLKESIPECDKAISSIEENKRSEDIDESINRIKFHKYSAINNVLNSYRGYTIKDQGMEFEWLDQIGNNINIIESFCTKAEKGRIDQQITRLNEYKANIGKMCEKLSSKIKLMEKINKTLEDIFKLITVRPDNNSDSMPYTNEGEQSNSKLSLDGGVGFKMDDLMVDVLQKLDKEYPGMGYLQQFSNSWMTLLNLLTNVPDNEDFSFDNYLLDNEHINEFRARNSLLTDLILPFSKGEATVRYKKVNGEEKTKIVSIYDTKQIQSVPPGQVLRRDSKVKVYSDEGILSDGIIDDIDESDSLVDLQNLRIRHLIINDIYISGLIDNKTLEYVPNNPTLTSKSFNEIKDDPALRGVYMEELKQDIFSSANPTQRNVNQIIAEIFNTPDRHIIYSLLKLSSGSSDDDIYLNNKLIFRNAIKIMISKLKLSAGAGVLSIENIANSYTDMTIGGLYTEYTRNIMVDKTTNAVDYAAPERIYFLNNKIKSKKVKIYKLNMNQLGVSELIRGFTERFKSWFIYEDINKDYFSLQEINNILAHESISYVYSNVVIIELERILKDDQRMNAVLKDKPELNNVKAALRTMLTVGKRNMDIMKMIKEDTFENDVIQNNAVNKTLHISDRDIDKGDELHGDFMKKEIDRQARQSADLPPLVGGGARRRKVARTQKNNHRVNRRTLHKSAKRANRRTVRG